MKAAFEFSTKARDLMAQIHEATKSEFREMVEAQFKAAGIADFSDAMAEKNAAVIKDISASLMRSAVAELLRNNGNWTGQTAAGNNFTEACIADVCREIAQNPDAFVMNAACDLDARKAA